MGMFARARRASTLSAGTPPAAFQLPLVCHRTPLNCPIPRCAAGRCSFRRVGNLPAPHTPPFSSCAAAAPRRLRSLPQITAASKCNKFPGACKPLHGCAGTCTAKGAAEEIQPCSCLPALDCTLYTVQMGVRCASQLCTRSPADCFVLLGNSALPDCLKNRL